ITLRPGRIRPSRSAASIIAKPIRSLTLPAGFWLSSFATSSGLQPFDTRLSRTSGVLPMSSVASRAIFIPSSTRSRSITRPRGLSVARPAARADELLDEHARIASGRENEAEPQHAVGVVELGAVGACPDRAARPAQAHAGREPQRREVDAAGGEHLALARRDGAARLGHVRAEDRAGRAD